MLRTMIAAGAGVLVAAMSAMPASAKPARCFTTDDGHYDCDFKGLDRQGSFEIRARGFPTYTLWIDGPGSAAAFADFGTGRMVPLGLHLRERDDGACWANPDTDTKICAW